MLDNIHDIYLRTFGWLGRIGMMVDVSGIKLIVDKSPEEGVSLSNRAVVSTTQSGFSATQ